MATGDIHTVHRDGKVFNEVEGSKRASNSAATKAAAQAVGRDMARIDSHATAFVLVDVPRAQRITGAPKLGGGTQSQAIGAALKNVSTVAIWLSLPLP